MVIKGLKQVLPPMLFIVYIQQTLETWYKKWEGMGFPRGDKTLQSQDKRIHSPFVDDQVLFTQKEEDIIYMM